IRDNLAKKVKEQKGSWQPLQLIRWQDALLRKAAQSPDQALAKAHEVLKVSDDLGTLRPTELQFLALLDRDVVKARRGDRLLGKALLLCRQAERVALGLRDEEDPKEKLPAYSEQVAVWFGKEIDKADQERRLGEDLLLATSADDWK